MTINKGFIKANEKLWREIFSVLYKGFNLGKILNVHGTHLDYGCGLGYFAKLLAEKHNKLIVHGLDTNRELIEFAQKRHNLPNLKYFTSNGFSRYDSISLNFVLHELPNPQKTLKEISKKLETGGKLFVYDFKKTSRDKFKKMYKSNSDPRKGTFEEEYNEHNKWDLNEFEKMLKKAGFDTISLKPFGDYWFYYSGKKK